MGLRTSGSVAVFEIFEFRAIAKHRSITFIGYDSALVGYYQQHLWIQLIAVPEAQVGMCAATRGRLLETATMA